MSGTDRRCPECGGEEFYPWRDPQGRSWLVCKVCDTAVSDDEQEAR